MHAILRWLRRLFCRWPSFSEAYDAAQLRDLDYAMHHPGCTWEEAHRERDAVLRDFHLY